LAAKSNKGYTIIIIIIIMLLEMIEKIHNLFRKIVECGANLIPGAKLHRLVAAHDVGKCGRHEQILLFQPQLFPAEKLHHFHIRIIAGIYSDGRPSSTSSSSSS